MATNKRVGHINEIVRNKRKKNKQCYDNTTFEQSTHARNEQNSRAKPSLRLTGMPSTCEGHFLQTLANININTFLPSQYIFDGHAHMFCDNHVVYSL